MYIYFQNKLGLFDKDEMSVGDMIETMTTLHKYVPVTADGKISAIPFGGDGLSVARGLSAKRSRSDGFSPEDKLEGLIPKPEDWHEGVTILQVRFYDFKI